jgi:hypothetical protein
MSHVTVWAFQSAPNPHHFQEEGGQQQIQACPDESAPEEDLEAKFLLMLNT